MNKSYVENILMFLHTVELGYSDLGCSDILAVASNIEWY
jgi:hypothetical protein